MTHSRFTTPLIGVMACLSVGLSAGCSAEPSSATPPAPSSAAAAHAESDLKVDPASAVALSSSVFTGRVVEETQTGKRDFLPTRNYIVAVGNNTKGTAAATAIVALTSAGADDHSGKPAVPALAPGKPYTFFASYDETAGVYVVGAPGGYDETASETMPSARAVTLQRDLVVTNKGIGSGVVAEHAAPGATLPTSTTGTASSASPSTTAPTQEGR